MNDIADAIQLLRPNAKFAVCGTKITWLDSTQSEPTMAQIEGAIKANKATYKQSTWLRGRQAAYAQLNQDEMRYDDLINGTTTWQDTIAAIKAKYPKPVV